MRSFLGMVPVSCITATADRGMQTWLANYLALSNPYTVILSPNKENIQFSVTQADKELCCLNWVVTKLRKEKKDCPYTIIFCQTVNDIALILSFLLTNLGEYAYAEGQAPLAERCLVTVYHSVTPEKMKERVKSSFASGAGTARIVIATTSLLSMCHLCCSLWSVKRSGQPFAGGRACRPWWQVSGSQCHSVSWETWGALWQWNENCP